MANNVVVTMCQDKLAMKYQNFEASIAKTVVRPGSMFAPLFISHQVAPCRSQIADHEAEVVRCFCKWKNDSAPKRGD